MSPPDTSKPSPRPPRGRAPATESLHTVSGRHVTVRDIAEAAGVSHSTVSRALQDSPLVREETRKKLKAVAERMGYSPDPMLSALTAYRSKEPERKQTNALAFVIAPFVVESWSDIISNAETQAERLGFDLQLHLWDPNITPAEHVSILQKQGVRGVVVGPTIKTKGDLHIPPELNAFSVVAVGRFLSDSEANTVAPDHFGSVGLALDRMREKGYRRIGLAVMERLNSHVGDRLRCAYVAYQLTLPEEERMAPFIAPAEETETIDIKDWIEREKPEALLAHTHVHTHLVDAGVRIPDDVAFAGLNVSGEYEGRVAGANINNAMVGRIAVNLLNNQLMIREMGEEESRQTIIVDTHWQDGPTAPGPRSSPKKQSA